MLTVISAILSSNKKIFCAQFRMGAKISDLLSSLSSLTSLSSSSRQTTFGKVVKEAPPGHDHNRPFTKMVKCNPHYGEWSNDKIAYDVHLVHCQLHWKLLVKKTNSKQLPFITFEIRTDDMKNLVPWQDTFSVSSVSASYVGTYVGTLNSLAQMADDAVEEMQYYDLLTSNCQVFCNKMLKRMGKPEFETTYRPEMIDRTFDKIVEDLTDTRKATGQVAPTSCMAVPSSSSNSELKMNESNFGAKLSCSTSVMSTKFAYGSAPMNTTKHESRKAVPVPSVSDLEALHKIFIPIKDNWMGIGNSLNLDPGALRQIKNIYKKSEACLREMLRTYLQKRNPLPIWQELVQAAEGYNLAVANSISRRAEYIRA